MTFSTLPCLRAHEVRVVSHGNVFYIFVTVCILMVMLAPDCFLSGVQTARYYVCNLFGYLHCIAHSTKHISPHCLCCVCLVLHEWHPCRQQSDSRNRSELVQLASSQQSSQAALVACVGLWTQHCSARQAGCRLGGHC